MKMFTLARIKVLLMALSIMTLMWSCRPDQAETEYNIADIPQTLDEYQDELPKLDEPPVSSFDDDQDENKEDDDQGEDEKKYADDSGDKNYDDCEDDFKLVDDYDDYACDPNIKKKIILGYTGDDKATIYYNSEYKHSNADWRKWSEIELEVTDCGVIAIHAEDTRQVISGLLAIIWEVDTNGNKGRVLWTTAENDKIKVAGPSSPTPGNLDWTLQNYNDDSAEWTESFHCRADAWGNLYAEQYKIIGNGTPIPNKSWIWYTSNCNTLKQAYFRFKFVFGAEKKNPNTCLGKEED